MTADAPLGSVRVSSAHVTEDHSAVSLLCDESPELRAWLWSTDRLTKGKAEGARFLLTVDGVKVEGRRVFSRPWCSIFRTRLITITSDPGDTRVAALGRKVGKPVYAAELVRVKGNTKQAKFPTMGMEKAKRVTVEGLPESSRESLARETS